MTKQEIQKMFINGNLKELLSRLIAENVGRYDIDTLILISGQLNGVNKQNTMGLFTSSEYTQEVNKVRAKLMSCLNIDSDNLVAVTIEPAQNHNSLVERLQEMVIKTKRRDTELFEKATAMFDRLNKLNNDKLLNPAFDVTWRKYKAFVIEAEQLLAEYEGAKEETIEVFVERVSVYLQEPIPKYEGLEEAYKLVVGKGMKDSFIERNLELKPEIADTRIEIAERIELFLGKLS